MQARAHGVKHLGREHLGREARAQADRLVEARSVSTALLWNVLFSRIQPLLVSGRRISNRGAVICADADRSSIGRQYHFSHLSRTGRFVIPCVATSEAGPAGRKLPFDVARIRQSLLPLPPSTSALLV